MSWDGGNEMCFNDIESRVQHNIKSPLMMCLVGDGLHQLFPGLSVHQSPEAILTVLQKGRQRRDDPDASLRWRQVDGCRLLHLLCIGQDGEQRRALIRHTRMCLNPQFFNQRAVNSLFQS